ncbi:MAG: hypothetical protein ACI4XP_11400 [Acutalibacteraceae bacterium]
MRTIRNLINNEKKVYIYLPNDTIRHQFMNDAQQEGITFADNVKPTERLASEIMALKADGTICFVGFVGRMCFHSNADNAVRIDYEQYINGADDYIIHPHFPENP